MSSKSSFSISTESKKIPIIITLTYFIVFSYVSFFHHNYWFEADGIFFLNWGNQILNGDGENVVVPNASVGGPILYAYLTTIFGDAFLVIKSISILGCTGIVFLSYFITKNIFNSKIALTVQLFFVFTSQLGLLSILAFNEVLVLFLIFFSFYFITKKQLKITDIVIVGISLGLASSIRFQGFIVFVSFLIFFLIQNKKISLNLKHALILASVFLLVLSPVLYYNYSTHEVISESSLAFHFSNTAKYGTTEWKNNLMEMHQAQTGSIFDVILLDFGMFMENYFYSLLYQTPNHLFNFDKVANISIIPLIPFIGIIPVILGFLHILQIKVNKKNVSIIFGSAIFSFLLVLLYGKLDVHSFAIIIIPVLIMFLIHFKNIQKNFLPLIILSIIFPLIISIVTLSRSYQLFPIWITVAILSAVFFVEFIPKIFLKFKQNTGKYNLNQSTKKIIIIPIFLILLVNIGFTYKLIDFWLYDQEMIQVNLETVYNEFFKTFSNNEKLQRGYESKIIGELLAKQPEIENSYIMSVDPTVSYYAGAKYLSTGFLEGKKNDTLSKFVSRENWSEKEKYSSNVVSNPTDRYDKINPKADYIVYVPNIKSHDSSKYTDTQAPQLDPSVFSSTQAYDLLILLDPENSEIPDNFELLYKSELSETVVYKINNLK